NEAANKILNYLRNNARALLPGETYESRKRPLSWSCTVRMISEDFTLKQGTCFVGSSDDSIREYSISDFENVNMNIPLNIENNENNNDQENNQLNNENNNDQENNQLNNENIQLNNENNIPQFYC